MNIVITSTENNSNAVFDLRFGRAAWFCLYNTESKEMQFLKNENMDAVGGAGTKAAELMIKKDVKKIVSGDFGPKAKTLLEEFKIQMIVFQDERRTIQEIINQFHK